MTNHSYSVVVDPEFGYGRLDPLPPQEEIDHYYQQQYYDQVEAGQRGPELNRVMQGGDTAARETHWLAETLWADIRDGLQALSPGANKSRLLDFGCGLGDFGRFMEQAGWQVTGVEMSPAARQAAEGNGLSVFATLEEVALAGANLFEAVTLLNVLAHVVDPAGLLRSLAGLLRPGGVLVATVPNNFSPMQQSAQAALGEEPWWIAVPDHLSYFDRHSLTRLLAATGFEMADLLGDFPMEMFLLMGDNYLNAPAIGAACHQKRVNFELSLPTEFRRQLYRTLAAQGVGRMCIAFARRREE